MWRWSLTLVALTALVQSQRPSYSPIQDGEPHGDPLYLMESGWEPLLNGKDLSGWKACDPGAKNEWYTTPFVRFERYLGPTQLNGHAAPGGTMLNGPTGRTANVCTDRALGHLSISEAAQNPLMLQGDHGPVAFRNIYTRPLRPLVVR